VDLLRCESVNSLDSATGSRVLQKNYAVLVTMAPLARETRSVISCSPPHLGPSVPEISSTWFKLWLYKKLNAGPPSMLFVTGTRLDAVPEVFVKFDTVMITASSNETHVVSTGCLLLTLNEMLCHSPVLVQGYSRFELTAKVYLPFPLPDDLFEEPTQDRSRPASPKGSAGGNGSEGGAAGVTTSTPVKGERKLLAAPVELLLDQGEPLLEGDDEPDTARGAAASAQAPKLNAAWISQCRALCQLDCVKRAFREFDLVHSCGYITLVRDHAPEAAKPLWTLFDITFGLPLFDPDVNATVRHEIDRKQLLGEANLRELTKSHRKEALELLNFVAQHQHLSLEIDPLLPPNSHSTPSPSQTIVSINGCISAATV
jgi:hypothetical protein